MNTSLSLDPVFDALECAVVEFAQRQVLDPEHPLHGAVINPGLGVDEPGHTGTALLIGAALLLSARESRGEISGTPWEEVLAAASAYLLRVQRPTGRIDMRDCNYDSDPDTAFALQLLCVALSMWDTLRPKTSPVLDIAIEQVKQFIRHAADGVASGGFHTPNHRWVVASALAQAGTLWPEMIAGFKPTIQELIAEQPDIDGEGCFIERSVSIYDAVCDRALLLIDELLPGGWQAGYRAALANLEFDAHLLHADGSVESGLSHRQDHGIREVPVNLIPVLLQASRRSGDDRWAGLAGWLWEKTEAKPLSAMFWIATELLRRPQASIFVKRPGDFSRYFPENRIWRVRRGDVSISAFGGTRRLLGLRHGSVELAALKIGQSYMGRGHFIADEIVEGPGADCLLLRSSGRSASGDPGYFHALGKPVSPQEWEALRRERTFRAVPPCRSTFEIKLLPEGLALRYCTEDGLDRVLAQVAFDFLPGGVWETKDACFRPAPGQVIFLKSGTGRMSYGPWSIEISGGADAHRAWQLRDFDPPGDLVRVLITFLTPVDHAFILRCVRDNNPLPQL